MAAKNLTPTIDGVFFPLIEFWAPLYKSLSIFYPLNLGKKSFLNDLVGIIIIIVSIMIIVVVVVISIRNSSVAIILVVNEIIILLRVLIIVIIVNLN